MKTLSFWKKSVYSGAIFFGTVTVLTVGYGALFGGLTIADKVGSGSGLTATSWNRIVDGVLDINTRLENLTFLGGNVGIGVSPSAKLEVNGTIKGNALDIPGTLVGATAWTVPYSTATPPALGYTLLQNFTLANTASLYTNTYTPTRASSYIYYSAILDVDRMGAVGNESLIMFINNTPHANSYHYPRVSGHEAHSMPISGVYTNTGTGAITFNIRVSNNGGWTNCIGRACGGTDQTMASTITLFEVAR